MPRPAIPVLDAYIPSKAKASPSKGRRKTPADHIRLVAPKAGDKDFIRMVIGRDIVERLKWKGSDKQWKVKGDKVAVITAGEFLVLVALPEGVYIPNYRTLEVAAQNSPREKGEAVDLEAFLSPTAHEGLTPIIQAVRDSDTHDYVYPAMIVKVNLWDDSNKLLQRGLRGVVVEGPLPKPKKVGKAKKKKVMRQPNLGLV